MRDWKQFSEDLEAWGGNPVTEILREAMARVCARRRSAMLQAYLAGNPWPEEDRKALALVDQWCEDFFASTAEDVRAVMERDDDEPQRHHADGIQRLG